MLLLFVLLLIVGIWGCVLSPGVECVPPAPPSVKHELITSDPPWPYAHECNVVELSNGDVLASWQAGGSEKQTDSKIWQATRDSASGEWSPVRVAVDGNGTCVENACMFENKEGRIYIIYHQGGNPNGQCYIKKWVPYISFSDDKGATWSQGEKMPAGSMGCVKNQCQTLSNGEVLCPSSFEAIQGTPLDTAHFETTDEDFSVIDVHKSIQFYFSNVTHNNCDGTIQPVIYEDVDLPGRIFALFRSGCGVLAQAESLDYGHTWPDFASSSHVVSPGSGVGGDVMRGHPEIGWLLAHNSSPDTRCPLALASSTNKGVSFDHLLDIETNCTLGMTYSYPFIAQSTNNPTGAHMCYTYGGDKAGPPGTRTIAYAFIQF